MLPSTGFAILKLSNRQLRSPALADIAAGMCTMLPSTGFAILNLSNRQHHRFAPTATLLIFFVLVFVLVHLGAPTAITSAQNADNLIEAGSICCGSKGRGRCDRQEQ
jgi:hypothetical protein